MFIIDTKNGSENISAITIKNRMASVRSGWYLHDTIISIIMIIDISNTIKKIIKFQVKKIIENIKRVILIILIKIFMFFLFIKMTIKIIQSAKFKFQNETWSPMKT